MTRGVNCTVIHECNEIGVVEQVPELALDVPVVHIDRDRAP